MAPNRGTDPATERRQLREREERDAVGRFLENAFDAVAEVGAFGLPVLLFVVFAAPFEAKAVVAIGTAALCGAVAVLRSGLVRVGPAWPPMSIGLAALRLVYYNLVFVAIVGAERLVVGAGASAGPVPPSGVAAGVAVALALGGAALFPTLTDAIVRRVP
jgi:hypothetical protein